MKRWLLYYATSFLVLPLVVMGQTSQDVQRGVEFFEAQKYEEAKNLFESIAKENPKNVTALFYLGRISFDEKDYDEAIDQFKKCVSLMDTSSEYHLWLGRAYGLKAQNAGILNQIPLAKKVKHEFEEAVMFDPESVVARFDLIQYYVQAPGFMGGSMEKAKEQAEEIKKRDLLRGHQALAIIYENEEGYDEAEKEHIAAIREDSSDSNLQFALGYFYQRRKEYGKASKTFEKILENDPNDLNAYYQIGRTGALSGENLGRAEECLTIYLESEPSENSPSLAWAHYRLGMVYEKNQEMEKARIEYVVAIELAPEHKEAKRALKKLK